MSIVVNSYETFENAGSKMLVNYGDKNDNDNDHLPAWFNLERFNQARKLFRKYFFSLMVAHLSGLLVLVFIRSIYETLSKTGRSKNLLTIFHRYLQTVIHVKKWYEGTIWNKHDDSYQSIKTVSRE